MINQYLLEPFSRSYRSLHDHRPVDEVVRPNTRLRARLGLRLVELGTSLIGDQPSTARAA